MDRAQGARIWMASEATDMRCGFDRLAERVNAVIGENPQSGHLFVFRSRRGDRLKILLWERDGFVRSGSVQNATRGKWGACGGIACERASDDSGWNRCFEVEARTALRTRRAKQRIKSSQRKKQKQRIK
jgi:transposase